MPDRPAAIPADASDGDLPAPAPSPPGPREVTIPAEPGERDYFPELDGLRFVAFALVYLFHQGVPQWNSWVRSALGLVWTADRAAFEPGRELGYRIQANGWIGVQLFFVLSGFLITTLLLREERRYGRIDLRSFWVRRILRIWPLYYLVLFLAIIVLPWAEGMLGHEGTLAFLRRQGVAFLAFLGNWSMGLMGPPPNDATSVLWSVCVEEQFYILCPLLLAFVPRRARVPLLVVLMIGAVGLRYRLAQRQPDSLLFSYSTLTHVDSLLGGVLLAFLILHPGARHRLERFAGFLTWPVLLAFAWILTRPDLARGDVMRATWDYVAIWLATAGLIAVLVVRRRGWIHATLGYSRIVWLGKISYGLYMYHEIALWLGHRGFARMGWFPNKEILQTIACFALTVGLAAASYTLFERPFLALKRAWTRVPSRPD